MAHTREIYHSILVHDHLTAAGQPTEAQLRTAADEGFTVVINLATHDHATSLPDEGGLVRSLGMAYYHIPVDWQNPTLANFEAFDRLLSRLGGEKVLLHCQANFRATAFYSLHAMKRLGWAAAEAEAFRAPVWQGSDYPIWERFIEVVRQKIGG